MMELVILILILIEVQADDVAATSFHSSDHFTIGPKKTYTPRPFYYCMTKIETCGEPRKRYWLPILRNIDNEICIVERFSSCMSRLPIIYTRQAVFCRWIVRAYMHDCSMLTNKEGCHYPPCLLKCYRERIKLPWGMYHHLPTISLPQKNPFNNLFSYFHFLPCFKSFPIWSLELRYAIFPLPLPFLAPSGWSKASLPPFY